jgi:hypothetical protein
MATQAVCTHRPDRLTGCTQSNYVITRIQAVITKRENRRDAADFSHRALALA